LSLAQTQRTTLIDNFVTRNIASDIFLVLAGVSITALAAQISVQTLLVPFTLQTLAVLVIGTTYGATRGAITMGAYAVLGALGFPVFSESSSGFDVIFGATGGFIIGFIFAAALAGKLAELKWSSNVLTMLASFVISTVVIYGLGIPVLAMNAFGSDLLAATQYMLPFLVWDAVKAVFAAALIPSAWLLVNKLKK
jgi:biotin transport system substrate-specific component